jgi:hypothetical protein
VYCKNLIELPVIQVRNYQIKPEIPVGGRLNFFQKNWEKITDDQWIISIMKLFLGIFLEIPCL